MFSLCPKCDSGKLDSTGRCKRCNYTLRNRCDLCGYFNIPTARFCGGCGQGMTLRLRFRNKINQHLNFFQQMRIRKFVAGAAFGGILTLFAFGSMGMRSDVELSTDTEYQSSLEYFQPLTSIEFTQPFGLNFAADLKELNRHQDPNRKAGSDDLIRALELLIKHLRPAAINVGATRLPNESASFYIKTVHFNDKAMNRGNVALVFFNFLADLLDFQYRDFSQDSKYVDIPRFHFLTVPANALASFGIKVAKNEQIFGSNEPLTVGQLFNCTREIVGMAETSLAHHPEQPNARLSKF